MHPTGRSHFPSLAGRPAIVLALLAGFLLHAVLPYATPPRISAWLPGALAIVLVLLLLVEVGAYWKRRQYLRVQTSLLEEMRTANSRLAMRIVELSRRGEKNELLESAVIHAHDAVVILDPDCQPEAGRQVLYVNEAFCRMTGYSRDEIVGRSLYLLRGPMSEPGVLNQVRRALDSGSPLQTEILNHRKDGSTYWAWINLVPVPNDAGGIAHWVMIQRDVTDRKTMETALRESEEKLRLVGDHLPDGAIFQVHVDLEGTRRFTFASAGMESLLGISRETVFADARSAYRLIHPDDRAAVAETESEAIGRLVPFDCETRIQTPAGDIKWLHVRAMPTRLPAGGSIWNGIIIDVTARQRLEEQLLEAQKLEAVGMLAGGIAHDFNNLLTGVLGNLALVQFPPGDPNRDRVATAERAAERAAELTHKLLAYARRNQLLAGPIAAEAALEGAAAAVRRTLDPRISLTIDVASGCDPVLADAGLLHRALVGLCMNACDAMPEGGTLTLSASPIATVSQEGRTGPYVRMSVADTGVGISDQLKPRIFDPFFTTKGIGKGVGLGLAMVRGIVNQHGGWVECESKAGEGTRIDLYLPAAQEEPATQEAKDDTQLAEEGLRTPCSPMSGDRPGTRDPLILLVDDESMIRDLGQKVLENAGFGVLTASDGFEAVKLFERDWEKIGLVVLDVTMPRMSGRETFHHLMRIDPEARVLFSTGYSVDEIAELDGSLGLLNKPYRPNDLLRAVREGLSATPVGP